MKTRFLFFLTMLLLFAFYSGHTQVSSFFEKYQDEDQLEYVELTKENLLKELNIGSSDAKDFERLTESLDLIQYIVSNHNVETLFDEAYKLVQNNKHESLIDVRSNNERVHGYVLEENGVIKEWLLLLRSKEEFVIGRITGEFLMSDFGDILGSFENIDRCDRKDEEETTSGSNINVAPIKQTEILDFRVFPNPIEKNQPLTIKFENKNKLANAHILVTDLSGKVYHQQPLSQLDPGQHEVTIRRENIDLSGSVIVSLVRNDKVLSEVIIVH